MKLGESSRILGIDGYRPIARYNHAMRPARAVNVYVNLDVDAQWFRLSLLLVAVLVIACTAGCTFYGEHPARGLLDATGGEGLERVFWKDVQAAKWVEVERALASNYVGVTAAGTFDRSAALEHYRQWQLKEFALGDLKTELNGTTFVVTYSIVLKGSMNVTSGDGTGGQALPSTPQHMMTVWQQQKAGWVAIAHSVSE